VFTVVSPVEGAVVPLSEAGGQVDVRLTVAGDEYFPFGVSITWDGQTWTDPLQFTGTQYQTPVTLLPMPLGSRSISVTCVNHAGLVSTQTRSVIGQDVAPPHVHVDDPPNVIGSNPAGKAIASIHGTATDYQSGMVGGSATVAWALTPTGTRTLAHPKPGNDFSDWTAEVQPLTGFGAHTIYVWATDQAGNATQDPEQVPVVVISLYEPKTLDERLNEREYLAALLSFAQEQIILPGTPPPHLDTGTLVGALGQPLDRLSQPLSAEADQGGQEVNQLRVPIELLRAYIAATHTATAPGAAGEASYRDTAYASLLAAYGTSYTELRLARGAAPADRQALAARLGIRLSAKSPDELDQLVLAGAQLSEAWLETLFGLPASTGVDPLRAPPTPLLLTWQLAAQALTWAEQDQHPNSPRKFVVLADPDVIGAPDVTPGPKGNPIRALLTQRAGQLKSFANSLEKARVAAADPAGGLAAILALALPGVNLADLAAKDRSGVDISAALASAGLSRNGFVFLLELGRVVATSVATQFEWADANAVLTAAHKQALYPAWRAQETVFVLSPDFFVLADAAPQVNAYRADGRVRASWQSVLRTRTAQRHDLTAASARAVAAAEQAALPILRSALLADLALSTTGNVGEEMSARFFVDMLAGGTLRTTRIRQAIESVQSLLLAKRSGELPPTHPAFAWAITDPAVFTNAWVWMGELGSWRAATMAFLFPERHLDPSLLPPNVLLPNAQPPLQTLFDNIRGSGPFSGADADQAATTYWHQVMGTTDTYLDQHQRRSTAHQNTLLTLSNNMEVPVSREIFWAVPLLLAQRLQSAGDFQSALDWYWILYPYDVYDVSKPVSIYSRINAETPFRPNLTFPPGWTAGLDPFALVATKRPTAYTRYTLLSIIRCHIEYADAEFTRETDESVANARTLYVTARRLLDAAPLQPLEPTNPGEPRLRFRSWPPCGHGPKSSSPSCGRAETSPACPVPRAGPRP
jgi:hypothetical protein